jgi:uncharacterized protein YegL
MVDQEYTHLALIVDRSGSMYGIASDMNGAIKELLDKQSKEPGRLVVDVTTFDDVIEFPYTDAAPADITEDLIMPRSNTALNDAIGVTIQRLGNKFRLLDEERRPGTVIVVIVTDGMENASKEYTRPQIKKMVDEQTDRWGWVFMYLAANVDAFKTGEGYGMHAKMSSGYVPQAAGVSGAYASLHANMSRARTGDMSGFTEEEREAANASE